MTAYDTAVLADSPIGYWPLDDNQPGRLIPTSSSASDFYPGETPANAFDGNESTVWTTNGGVTAAWLRGNLATAATVAKYSITGRSGFANRNPNSWTFQGSNDSGATWVTLDTRTGITWTGGETKTFSAVATTAYSSYRLNVSSVNGGSNVNVTEFILRPAFAVDMSGNGRDATYLGTVGYLDTVDPAAPTPLGDHVRLDGSTGYILLPSGTWFAPAGVGYSVEMWVRIRSWTNWQRLYDFGSTESYGANGSTGMRLYAGSYVEPTPRMAAAVWKHVVVTISSTGAYVVYEDKVVKFTGTLSAPGNGDRLLKYIGKSSGADPNTAGSFAKVALYHGVLSGARVGAHYDAGAGTTTPTLVTSGVAQEVDSALAGVVSYTVPTPTDAYSAVVLADSPLAYWKLGEPAGLVAEDYSGNGRRAVLSGSYSRNASPITGASDGASTDFATAVLTRADESALRPLSSTVEAWFVADSVTGLRPIISRASVGAAAVETRSYALYILDSVLYFMVRTISSAGGSATWTNRPVHIPYTQINVGGRYHIVLTVDGTSSDMTKLYLNGVRLDGESGTVGVGSGLTPAPGVSTLVGSTEYYPAGDFGTHSTEYFDGRIDEVALYGTALSAARVLAHYTAGFVSGGTYSAGIASETDTVPPGVVVFAPRTYLSGTATEGDSARSGTVLSGLPPATLAGVASETDTVPAATVRGSLVLAGGLALETDVATTGSLRLGLRVFAGVAVEGEVVLLGQVISGALALLGQTATETDTAPTGHVLVPPTLVLAGRAFEVDTALVGGVLVVVPTPIRRERWTFTDMLSGDEWEMPISPDSMTPLPSQPRRQMRHGFGKRRDVRVRTMVGTPRAVEWSFGGVIRTREHHDQLAAWARTSNGVVITDHLGRHITVFFTSYEPTDRRPNFRTPWRMRYTMKCYVLEIA